MVPSARELLSTTLQEIRRDHDLNVTEDTGTLRVESPAVFWERILDRYTTLLRATTLGHSFDAHNLGKASGVELIRSRQDGIVRGRIALWGSVISSYTTCQLTKESDKLPALSGIAKFLQPVLGKEYLAGIWRENIHMYLTWMCTSDHNLLKKPRTYRAPSWSWASTENPIRFTANSLNIEGKYSPTPLLRIIAAETTLMTSDSTGRVSDGFLLVEGPLNRVQIHSGEHALGLLLDYLDEPLPGTSISLDTHVQLPVHCFSIPLLAMQGLEVENLTGGGFYVFLLLQESIARPGCYVRCGIGSVQWGRMDQDISKLSFMGIVSNAQDAPCEEYLGPKQGHRIRIL